LVCLLAREEIPEAQPATLAPPPGVPQLASKERAVSEELEKATQAKVIQLNFEARRFHFTVAPDTPLKDLLPIAPKARQQAAGPLLSDSLAQVPEVLFQEPQSPHLLTDKAQEQTAHQIAKINFLNQKEEDGFLRAFVSRRPDLAGLPFAMGRACRTPGEQSQEFKKALATLRRVLQEQTTKATETTPRRLIGSFTSGPGMLIRPGSNPQQDDSAPAAPRPSAPPRKTEAMPGSGEVAVATPVFLPAKETTTVEALDLDTFWEQYQQACAREDRMGWGEDRGRRYYVAQARVAALMQVLATEPPAIRLRLVQILATISHPEATRALARLAVFSPEKEVQRAAVDALLVRRERDYTDILLQGLRYPLPAVARRAGDALARLERADLVPQLVALLEEPDPRSPVVKTVKGRKVPVVREVVRLNHHRSCLVCHAPGNTPDVSAGTLLAEVPTPGTSLPSPSEGYQGASSDLTVRVDVTYLRQDFSALLPVANANPWPEMQRFDFLVRERVLTDAEAETYRVRLADADPDSVPPYRRVALAALRELTGRDTEPTPEAWRRLLNLPERSGAGGAE
jgi:hypothetical protein